MATLQQLETALVNADKAGDMEAARRLVGAIKQARTESANLIPGTIVPGTEAQAPEPTLGQQLVGAGETALTLGTGATGGAVGAVGGALGGLAQQILSGQFGTPEAVKAVEQAAAQGAQALTYQPRTQAGQEQVQATGQFLSNVLPPVIPQVAGLGALSQATRQAMPVIMATGQRGASAAQQVAQRTGQAVARPIQAATTAVRETLGIEAAPAATGGRVSVGAAATPGELQRVTTAEGLRVPVTLTKGAAGRDAEQLAFEKEQMKGEFGSPLRNRAEENNLQILQNFDAAIDATGAEAAFAGPSATGSAVVNALTSGYAAAKNKVRVAYKAAENAGELEVPVTHSPLAQFINDSTPEATVAPILSVAREKGIQLGLLIDNGDGTVSAAPGSLKNSELLRRSISNATGIDPTNQLFGGRLKTLIDADTEGLGGNLYKQARALRTEQARKFENRAVVARLIKNRKGMADPQVAIDQVFQRSIMGGSPEEITFLKRVLLTSGKDGQQAWKELQAATMQHIRDQATSGVGTDSAGRPLVSPAKLNQVVSQLDKNGRIDVMFGKKEAQLLRDLNEVVKYVTTVPPGTLINSSGTAGTLMAAMAGAGVTGSITGLPLPIVTGIKQIIKMRKEGRTKAKINEALNALPPVQP
jgi:hypothetical protein